VIPQLVAHHARVLAEYKAQAARMSELGQLQAALRIEQLAQLHERAVTWLSRLEADVNKLGLAMTDVQTTAKWRWSNERET
jgi:hypothetical protein